MTTIRRVFEEFNVDITNKTFSDIYEMVCERRDFSEESLKILWGNTYHAKPLQEGETVT